MPQTFITTQPYTGSGPYYEVPNAGTYPPTYSKLPVAGTIISHQQPVVYPITGYTSNGYMHYNQPSTGQSCNGLVPLVYNQAMPPRQPNIYYQAYLF